MTPISINTDTTIGIDIVDIWVDASAIRVRFYEPGVVHKAFRPLDLGSSFSPAREAASQPVSSISS